MILRKFLSCVLLLGLAFPTFSQIPSTQPSAETPVASSNKADGIELPSDQTVKFDEGFVTLQAKCKGEVKWLVISANKIKYLTLPTNNTIVISIPPQGGLITVFAVGLVDGKLTDFTRTAISITGNTPAPNPNPNPNPTTAKLPIHVTFIVDLNNSTPALAQILNSQKVREAITTKNAFYRLYDAKSPKIAEKGLDKILAQAGGVPLIVVQSNDGLVIDKMKITGTEADIINYLNQVLGGIK